MNWRFAWLLEKMRGVPQSERWVRLCSDPESVLMEVTNLYDEALRRVKLQLLLERNPLFPALASLHLKLGGSVLPTIRDILLLTDPVSQTIPVLVQLGVERAVEYMQNAQQGLDLPVELLIFTPGKENLSDRAYALAITAHLHEQVCIQLLHGGLVKDDVIHAVEETVGFAHFVNLQLAPELPWDNDLFNEMYVGVAGSTGWISEDNWKSAQERFKGLYV